MEGNAEHAPAFPPGEIKGDGMYMCMLKHMDTLVGGGDRARERSRESLITEGKGSTSLGRVSRQQEYAARLE
jgi:hypothetical protein